MTPLPNVRLVRRVPAWLRWLRTRLRASEFAFIVLAIGVGMAAGLLTLVQGALAGLVQNIIYGVPLDFGLSGMPPLTWLQLAMLPLGGVLLSLFNRSIRSRRRTFVDAVEANALHGGRMSVPDSLVVSGQNVISNGFGASVGLEAGYTQLGGMLGSFAGRRMRLRRGDMRILVGAGAGAAIAAAFAAPLAGAFYAFEVVIGAYTPAAIAPVAAASLAGAQVAQRLGLPPYIVTANPGPAIHSAGYLLYAGLGASCALLAILIMRSVSLVEGRTRGWMPWWARPIVGGALLIPVALISPQVLSAGHIALHLNLPTSVPIAMLATILAAKCVASVVSIGFGFRGGLFFASLFLGTLAGHLYADLVNLAAGQVLLDPGNAALVGMAALAVAVVGGPMTMAMLVLGATGNFSLTGAVVAASLVSSTIVREMFGYSFSTWRLHLRGEAIKSARDVGWIKTLTAGRMMRKDDNPASADITVTEFRRRYPLGSTNRVVLIDDADNYAGIVTPAAAYAEGIDPDMRIADLAHVATVWLSPDMHIGEIMEMLDRESSDELAVLDAEGKVLGVISDGYVRRRYAEELEKAQQEMFGER